jgi:drug/metabolite transporter (DMT)-like permease
VPIPWYVTAIAAALVWGIHYPLIDFALKKISLPTVLFLTALPMILITPAFYKSLSNDYLIFIRLNWTDKLPILALGITSILASVLLFVSISGKNATLASLIEITYPIFVALFAFVLFREIQINTSVFLGAMLVFAGISIIIINNP